MRAENNGYRNGQVLVNGQFRQKTKRVINILLVFFLDQSIKGKTCLN